MRIGQLLALCGLSLLIVTNSAMAAHAIAMARKANGIHYYWTTDQPSVQEAERRVLRLCKDNAKKNTHKSQCEVVGRATGPKYIAFFNTNDGTGFGFASDADRQQAIDRAFELCQEQGPCPTTAQSIDFDSGEQPQKKPVASPKGECSPPAGQTLRYSDRCVNGDCLRTFSNGCTKRFQAKYCYDPLQQNWSWKPDGC